MMIICVGEILADLIGTEDDGQMIYKRYAGGAPFNVACGLQSLGTLCGFCCKVGKAYTMGIKQIMQAKKILMDAFGRASTIWQASCKSMCGFCAVKR